MNIDTNSIVTATEANQNFSKVARMVDEHGTAVILKNKWSASNGQVARMARLDLSVVNEMFPLAAKSKS